MSLWYESLGLCLYDCEEDAEQRAKCILEHLSMDVPRFWRERALAGCRKTAPEAAIQRCASLQCSHMCVFRAIPATNSGRKRPPIPGQSGHPLVLESDS